MNLSSLLKLSNCAEQPYMRIVGKFPSRLWAVSGLLLTISGSAIAQTYQSQVSINGAATIRQTIPTSLYGANLEWVHNSWGAWNPATNALTPAAATLTQRLGPTVLRFPGGIFSDFYNWRNGTGTLSTRPTTYVTTGPDSSVHTFGTTEALRLASSIGARLMITVNVGTGTPEDAAAWVRFVNARSTVVRDWELGNELYIRTLSSDASLITMSPEVYAQKVKAFAAAMKAADPKIRIGAIGGDETGILPVVQYPGWNQIVLQQAGSSIDFLSVHNAYSPVMFYDNGESLETVYRAMLSSSHDVKTSLDSIASHINQFAPSDARSRIQIVVSEWGPLFHTSPLSRFVDHPKTLASALMTASVLMTFIEQPKVEAAQYFKMYDNSFAGLLGLRNGAWQETAPFYALQLFRRNFGVKLISTTVQSPAYRTDSAGIVTSRDGNSLLQAVSSLNAKGTVLYVMLLNKSLTDATSVSLNLSNLKLGATATVRTLRGTGIDANTGTQLPTPDKIAWATQAVASTNPRFYQGAPGEVGIVTQSLSGIKSTFSYTVPAASLVALEIPLVR